MANGIFGLSGSGLDIDQMVQDLMKARRARYDAIYQKRVQLEWKKADYTTMYTAVNDFNKVTFDFQTQSTLTPKKVTSSDESKVVVSALADAASINHTIEISQLAEGVTKTSSAAVSATTGVSKGYIYTHLGLDPASLPADGKVDIKLSDGVNEKTIQVDLKNSSLNTLASQINSSGLNIRANYDSTLDRFTMSTTKTGADAKIQVTADATVTTTADGPKNLMKDLLHLDDIDTLSAGKNAKVRVDGVDAEFASNTFTVSGVTYTAKATTSNADYSVTTPISVAVSPDIDKIVSNVKEYVGKYNELLLKIYGEVNETKYSDFLPLTDAQKKEMSETEIKQWEEKAKSGMLRRDNILRDTVQKMRGVFASIVGGLSGDYRTASAIGITAESYVDSDGKLTSRIGADGKAISTIQEGGLLEVNETKLRAALEKDPDIAQKIFGTNSETAANDGLAVKMESVLDGIVSRLRTESGGSTASMDNSNLGVRIKDYNEQLDAMLRRLEQEEDRYYKQFSAMETALNSLNQQSAWLTQQFSSGS